LKEMLIVGTTDVRTTLKCALDKIYNTF